MGDSTPQLYHSALRAWEKYVKGCGDETSCPSSGESPARAGEYPWKGMEQGLGNGGVVGGWMGRALLAASVLLIWALTMG